jgi:hypothetical protein
MRCCRTLLLYPSRPRHEAPCGSRCMQLQVHASSHAYASRCMRVQTQPSQGSGACGSRCMRVQLHVCPDAAEPRIGSLVSRPRETFEQAMSKFIQGLSLGLRFRVCVYIAVLATWSSFFSSFFRIKATPDTL